MRLSIGIGSKLRSFHIRNMAEKKRRQRTGSHQQVITPKPRAMPPQRPHSLSASPPTHAQHSPCPEPLAWHPGQCTPAHRTRPLSLIVSTDLQGNPQEVKNKAHCCTLSLTPSRITPLVLLLHAQPSHKHASPRGLAPLAFKDSMIHRVCNSH